MTPLRQRATRLAPYFQGHRSAWGVAALASVFMAATEPTTAWLLQLLIDHGFKDRDFPLWWVPAVVIGLFLVRGVAGFVAQYALAWAANESVLGLRRAIDRKSVV
jgi:subfamily B ATP-binding cassette protein MsbA